MPPPYLVVLLLSILLALGASWAAYEQQRKTRELLSQITGGESFIYLEPLRKTGRVRYFVRHTGNHPAYDVVVRVQEVLHVLGPSLEGKRRRVLIFGPADVGRTLIRGSGLDWTHPEADDVGRKWPLVFEEPPSLQSSPREFRIEFAARNGIVVQRFRVSPIGDRWHTELVLLRRPGAATLPLPADFKEAQKQPPNPPEDYDDGE